MDPNNYSAPKAWDGSYITSTYSGSVLSVTVDLAGQKRGIYRQQAAILPPEKLLLEQDGRKLWLRCEQRLRQGRGLLLGA
jgi:hypothetical protein